MRIPAIGISKWKTNYNGEIYRDGYVSIGTTDANEYLTIDGVISLYEQGESPGETDGYGKIYVKSDAKLYFKDKNGGEHNLAALTDIGPLSEAIQTILKDLDGYSTLTTTQGSDGYIAFFNGANAIAGDNDLYWNRETNQLLVGDGTSALPSISFNNDSNTGIYRVGADEIGFVTGSGIRARINNTAAIFPGVRLYDTIGPLNLGTAATSGHSLATGDVLVGGKLEVDGVLWADTGLVVASQQFLQFGSSSEALLGFSTVQTPDSLVFSTGIASNGVIVTSRGNYNKDHTMSQQTNPTVRVYSATDPTSDNTQWLSLAHDQTDGVLATGLGNLQLSPAGGQVVVPNGSVSLPGLRFVGQANSGFYRSANNEISLTLAGIQRMKLNENLATLDFPNGFVSSDANGFQFFRAAPTATVPGFVPNKADPNTGIGWAGADQLSLIAGGLSAMTLTSTGVLVAQDLTIGGDIINTSLSSFFEDVTNSLDGYASLTASGADGYIAFFTGPSSIAGDNDLRFNRETNQLLVSDGTSALPGIGFSNDPDTGIYLVNPNQIGFSALGVVRMTVTNAQIGAYVPLNMVGSLLYDSTGPLQLGTAATTNHSLTTGDAIFGGQVEFNGLTWFDATLVATQSIFIGGAATPGDTRLTQSLAAAQVVLGLGSVGGNHIVLTTAATASKDYDHASTTNPTLFIHSTTDPDTDNTQWLSIAHDQTNARLETGSGGFVFNPANDMFLVDGYIQATGYISTSDVGDGYVAFFTGDGRIVGDNDLQFNRETNQLLVGDGTNALPSISFNNDPDTGFTNGGTPGVISIVANGQVRVAVQASGDTIFYRPLNMITQKIHDSTGPLQLGTAAASSHSLATGDVIVGGKLEVDGQAWFDAPVVVSVATIVNQGALAFVSNDANHSRLEPSTGKAQLLLGLGPTLGRHLAITAMVDKDFDHPVATDPTLFIHSAVDPDTDNTQWLSLAHDQTVARLETGSGGIVLNPAGNMVYVDGYLQVADWKVEDGYITGTTTVNGQLGSAEVSPLYPDGVSCSIDFNLGNVFTIDLEQASGTLTVSLSNGIAGFYYAIKVIQDSASPLDITWDAAVKWEDGIAPVISVGARAEDIISLVKIGDYYYGSVLHNAS